MIGSWLMGCFHTTKAHFPYHKSRLLCFFWVGSGSGSLFSTFKIAIFHMLGVRVTLHLETRKADIYVYHIFYILHFEPWSPSQSLITVLTSDHSGLPVGSSPLSSPYRSYGGGIYKNLSEVVFGVAISPH